MMFKIYAHSLEKTMKDVSGELKSRDCFAIEIENTFCKDKI